MTQKTRIRLFYTTSSKIHSQCRERIIRYIKSHTIRSYKDSIRLYDKLFRGNKAVFMGHKEIVHLITSYRAQKRFERNNEKRRRLIVHMKKDKLPLRHQYSLKVITLFFSLKVTRYSFLLPLIHSFGGNREILSRSAVLL